MLYQGIAFSPQTALTQNINATETIIRVADITVFPDAPNYATIGTDEDGETIMYAAKADGMLSGCTRGVEGTAKPWNAGEVIARNFTAKDQSDMIDELSKKQNKLTGTASQVVGFGSDGNATAVERWSNRNLLDNWYFVKPINQSGQIVYTGNGYTIDRWNMGQNDNNQLEIQSGYIHLHLGNIGAFSQRLESPQAGKLHTLSFLTYENNLYSVSFVMPSGENVVIPEIQIGDKTLLIFVNRNGPIFHVNSSSGTSEIDLNLVAVKLELGPVQTLAHKEGDTWVLNDPPPNPALELAKCQRYLYKALNLNFDCGIPGEIVGTHNIAFDLTFPVMRTAPVLVGAPLVRAVLRGADYEIAGTPTASSVVSYQSSNNRISLNAKFEEKLPDGIITVTLDTGGCNTPLLLSAEL